MVLKIQINILLSKIRADNSPFCSETRLSAYYVPGTDHGKRNAVGIRMEKVS